MRRGSWRRPRHGASLPISPRSNLPIQGMFQPDPSSFGSWNGLRSSVAELVRADSAARMTISERVGLVGEVGLEKASRSPTYRHLFETVILFINRQRRSVKFVAQCVAQIGGHARSVVGRSDIRRKILTQEARGHRAHRFHIPPSVKGRGQKMEGSCVGIVQKNTRPRTQALFLTGPLYGHLGHTSFRRIIQPLSRCMTQKQATRI